MDLLGAIHVLATYLMVSIAIGGILWLLPSPLSSLFDSVGEVRRGISRLVQSLYGTRSNMEVNVLAIFIAPMTVLLGLQIGGQALLLVNEDYVAFEVWLMVALVFVMASFSPTTEEMVDFRDVRSFSVFTFGLKLALVVQLIIDGLDDPLLSTAALAVLIAPISPFLIRP